MSNTNQLRKKPNQYTDAEFLSYLKKKFKHKKNKNQMPFELNDVNQYCLKKALPKCYGGNKLKVEKVAGKLRLITIVQ